MYWDNNDEGESCVLLVGTAGTGKTTTLNIYTGNNEKTGDRLVSILA